MSAKKILARRRQREKEGLSAENNGVLRVSEGENTCSNGKARQSIPVLSFFTGGGFLDLGFERTGFRTLWSNEFNPAFADLHDHVYTTWRRAGHPNAAAAKISSRESITKIRAPE